MSIEQTYMEQARLLVLEHGKLVEVICSSDSITFVYQDGYKWKDEVFMKVGYYGQGPFCFYNFLQCSGWDYSPEQIANIRTPVTLRQKR